MKNNHLATMPSAKGAAKDLTESISLETGLEDVSTQDIYREILRRFDGDPTRDGLLRTPERVEKAMSFLTKGYQQDPTSILRDALFDVDYDEMVIVKDIEMFSLCEHHMLPFFGKVHVAYIPNGKVIGLSKIPRLVEVFARRLSEPASTTSSQPSPRHASHPATPTPSSPHPHPQQTL